MSRMEAIRRLAEVFREHGYEGASLAAITRGTGLGKGSLYHYFPGGKAEMAEQVLAHIDAWFEEEVFAPLDAPSPAPEKLGHMFRAVERYFHGGGRTCLVGAFALDATRDRFALQVRGYFQRWVNALAAALEQAAVSHGDAVRMAESTVAGIQGALVLARALGDREVFGRSLVALREELEQGLQGGG